MCGNRFTWDILFTHFHDRIYIYCCYASVMDAFFWNFIIPKNCMNYTIKYFYFSFYVFFIINRLIWNSMPRISLIFFQISIYFTNVLSHSILNNIFYPSFSNYFIYPLTWDQKMHKDLIISSPTTTRRQFSLYHTVPRSSWYSLNQTPKDERLSWS